LNRRRANIPNTIRNQLTSIWATESIESTELVRQLHRHCIAICHSPQYEIDNKDGLAQDWARVPLPRTRSLFQDLVDAGNLVTELLDPLASAEITVRTILGPEAISLGRVERVEGGSIRENELVISYAYYGAAKGRWEPRAFTADETAHSEWGENTGDLYLSERIRLRNVPELVWKYEIGGYPVLKKWLGYRDGRRRPGSTLSLAEIEHFRSMIQRIASLLVLHPKLDRLYEMCLVDCIRRDEVLGTA
jgi:hypothetical protein